MSLLDKANKIKTSVTAIREALKSKGLNLPDSIPLSEVAPKIDELMTKSWYGIQIDLVSKSKTYTRIGDMSSHKTLPVQSKIYRYMADDLGREVYRLGDNDSTVKADGQPANLNCVDGNILLNVPDTWVKIWMESDTLLNFVISVDEIEGFTKVSVDPLSFAPAQINRTADKLCCGVFLQFDESGNIKRLEDGSLDLASNATDFRGGNNSDWDGTYRSLLGFPATNMNNSTLRTKCKNTGDRYHHGAYPTINLLAWLYTIEYANSDWGEAYNPTLTEEGYHQGGMGMGSGVDGTQWNAYNGYNPYIPVGVTAKLGNQTGVVDYTIKNWKKIETPVEGGEPTITYEDKTIKVCSYRGWENPILHLWIHCDGVMIWHGNPTEGKSYMYLCEDYTKFANPKADTDATVPEGYEKIGEVPRANGYITKMTILPNGMACPTENTGGGATMNYCDHFWTPTITESSYGWYQLILLGNGSDGTQSGLRCSSSDFRFSHTYASRGCFLCVNR